MTVELLVPTRTVANDNERQTMMIFYEVGFIKLFRQVLTVTENLAFMGDARLG
jgi:hypothetical protein